jgi:hypothetical protein
VKKLSFNAEITKGPVSFICIMLMSIVVQSAVYRLMLQLVADCYVLTGDCTYTSCLQPMWVIALVLLCARWDT